MVVTCHYKAIEALKHVEQSISDCIDYSQCWRAAAGKHIALVRRLDAAGQHNKHKFSLRDAEHAMVLAAQVDVLKLQFLHGGDIDHFTTSAFDNAAENGHLEVVKWLHQNRSEAAQVAEWTVWREVGGSISLNEYINVDKRDIQHKLWTGRQEQGS
ncbi:unnamed protein product [Peronospora destructor]|uniref:Uncharacterized protein n=1 Tax=Peronospora destructor TaxID=86335 RepID=A0AAV0UQB0_9STRA|nr:unnamed protein product [Peronospora destructor]